MDSYEIIITPDAETDLFEIRDYIAYTLLVPDIALNYIRAIRSELQKTDVHGFQYRSYRTGAMALQRCAKNHRQELLHLLQTR